MARTRKIGLEYFPLDTDMFQDIKVRKLIKFQGGKAVTVYALLLCLIYKDGYYMRWDEELPFIVSEQTGFEEAYIREVITCCMKVGLFDAALFREHQIITSLGVQKRYKLIKELSRCQYEMKKFCLIPSQEKAIPSQEKAIPSQEKAIPSQEKALNVKLCNKGNKIKGNKIKENLSPLPSPLAGGKEEERESERVNFEDFQRKWNECIKYYDSAVAPIRSMSDERRGMIDNLLQKGYSKKDMVYVIRAVVSSRFLNGKTKEHFVASFDWAFTEKNFLRILEGSFNNK